MKIDVATLVDIREVALNMRERDLEEFSAVYAADTRHEIANVLGDRYGWRTDIIVAKQDDVPVAVGGVMELRPNVLTLFFLATPAFDRIVLPLSRYIKWRLFPPLIEAGVHRIEAVTLDTYTEMHRWLELLGLSREATHPCFGKRRETFATYAWVKGELA
jgi:hypothetical protein